MQSMIGRNVRVIGFDEKGDRYPVSKGTLVDYLQSGDNGLVEVQLSYEGMVRVVKISERMIVEEFPE
ncbi:MAG: hypothetical protein GWN86_23315 [Desulfobacterales bacterium]|nr:hypothetical protein [Desulfobacterales bacterium]